MARVHMQHDADTLVLATVARRGKLWLVDTGPVY
jgi:hypothetical protein